MLEATPEYQPFSWVSRFLRGLSGKHILLDGDPYLTRYYVLGNGSGKRYEIYLHHIQREDPYRWLHNHPWRWFVSIVLRGHYIEEVIDPSIDAQRKKKQVKFTNLFSGDHRYHAISDLPKEGTWTLVLVPPKIAGARRWGYWNEDEKIHEPDLGDAALHCTTIRFGPKQTYN